MATTTAQLKPATDADAAPATPAKKKSKKKLIMMLVPLLMVGVGGYLMFGKKEGPPPPPKAGAVIALEPITVNLAGGHFLKLGLALQATAAVKEGPDGSKALDIAISEFSNRTVAELSSNKARAKVKDELRKKVIEAYEKEVMDLFFTEFVMQ